MEDLRRFESNRGFDVANHGGVGQVIARDLVNTRYGLSLLGSFLLRFKAQNERKENGLICKCIYKSFITHINARCQDNTTLIYEIEH